METIEIESPEKTILKMRLLLGLDYICWIGATIALWWYVYPTVAAVVGATAVVYLRWATKKFTKRKQDIKTAVAVVEQIEEAMKEFNANVENKTIYMIDDKDDLIKWIESEIKDEDDHPNP